MAWIKLGSSTWGGTPLMDVTFEYEKQRSGSDMKYRARITVGKCSGGSYFGYPIYAKVTINGSLFASKTMKESSPNQWTSAITYTTGWCTVSNKTSGTVPISFRLHSNYRDATYPYTMAIDPAASVFSTLANGTLDKSQTIAITRYSTAFTHSIKAVCGSSTLYIKADGTTSTSEVKHTDLSIPFTPPAAWGSQNTTSFSLSVKFTLTTYSGSSVVGTSAKTVTMTIPDKNPSCSIAVSDPTGYKTTYGDYVRGYSKFKVVVTPTLAYSSPIASYSVSANGSKYTTSSATTGVLKSSGSLKVSATVKDKRGNSGSDEETVTVLNYSKPTISKLTVARCDSDGTANDQGSNVKVTFAYSITSLNGINTVKGCALQYKKTSDSDYITPSDFDPSVGSYIFAAETDSSYEVVLSVTDDLSSNYKTVTASTVYTIMHWKANGRGMGIGKISEEDDTLDVGFDVRVRKNVILDNVHEISGVTTDGDLKNAFQAQNENNNTVVGYGNFRAQSGGTHIYGHDLLHGVSNIPSPGTYRPYRRAGDSLTITLRTAGYVTNAGKDVSFWIPMTMPPIGSPTVTITSGSGFALRQGNTYTHGSSASVMVFPDSYEATASMYHGIYVKAVFSNITNVTNNDAIGIYWNGTITFS